jgi:hypothetical protein
MTGNLFFFVIVIFELENNSLFICDLTEILGTVGLLNAASTNKLNVLRNLRV